MGIIGALTAACGVVGVTMGSPVRSAMQEEPVWTTAASLPLPRGYTAAATLSNGSVLVVGGTSTWSVTEGVEPTAEAKLNSPLASTVRYEPSTNTWHEGPSLSAPRYDLCLTRYGDSIAAIGGIGSGSLNTMEVLDLATNTWMRKAPMSSLKGATHCTTLQDGQILAIGTSCELYSPVSQTWKSVTCPQSSMPTSPGVTTLQNGTVMSAGGYNSVGITDVHLSSTPGTWTKGKPLLYGRWAMGLVTLHSGDVLAVGGGHAAATPIKTVELLNIKDGTWSYTTPLPAEIHAMAVSVMNNGSVLVAGGRTTGSSVTSAVHIYTDASQASTDYRCEANACVQVPAGEGVPKEECDRVCGPPIDKYECVGGRCSRSANGVDKAVCEQICRPADPAPFVL